MRNWRLLFLFLLCFLIPTRAAAQGNVQFESMDVALWAEYDQPSMLVIQEFVVSKSASLPVKATVRFPSEGNLIAAAYEMDGQLVNAPFENSAEQGGWKTIILTVEEYAPYRIEYYQPLKREGNKRSFTFDWLGDYPVKQFNLQVQLPADSANVQPSFPFASLGLTSDGAHLLGTNEASALKLGQPYQLTISYERESETLSDLGAVNQVQLSAPIDEQTPGRASVDQIPWLIGLAGLAMIAFSVFFYWRSLRGSSASGRQTRRRAKTAESETAGQARYCHECGARSASGDRFCRTCGNQLRPK